MNRILILISTILCFSCSSSLDKSELVGKWVSNKKMTLSSIGKNEAKLSKQMSQFLESNLGTMAYTFTQNGTIFTAANSQPVESEMLNWSVIESTSEQIVINVSTSWFKSSNVTFQKTENCIGLVIESQPYIEYFCKQ